MEVLAMAHVQFDSKLDIFGNQNHKEFFKLCCCWLNELEETLAIKGLSCKITRVVDTGQLYLQFSEAEVELAWNGQVFVRLTTDHQPFSSSWLISAVDINNRKWSLYYDRDELNSSLLPRRKNFNFILDQIKIMVEQSNQKNQKILGDIIQYRLTKNPIVSL